MKLSIIIPVFNEEKTIRQVIQKITSLVIPNTKIEILIVDDASTDNTTRVIQDVLRKFKHVQFFSHKKNLGKGSAVRTAIQHVSGEYIVIQDADLEYNPKDILLLVNQIKKDTKVVFGTRLNRLPNFSGEERKFQFVIQYVGNKFLSAVTSILYGQWITDMETGYKLFPTEIARKIRLSSQGFEFEPEITAKLMKAGLKILEIPITTNPRSFKQGKKLRPFRDGPIALWTLIKYRFTDA